MTEMRPDANLGHLITCPKCGRSNPPGTRYCESCGARLTGETGAPKKAPEEEKKPGFLARLFGRRDEAA
jgi:predicted amidophosphoribosyltransferase